MSFASLKKQSNLGSLTAKLVKEVEKVNNSSGGGDERLWKPELDKTGNGYAVIRFLPAPDKEEIPWAKLYTHAFQGPGGWYIENSLTTVGGKDPVSDYNRELWNSGNESDKDVVRKQKRKLSYYSNIYVVKDPTNPQNEGKVFLFKYGKKIFDKVMEAMQPEFEDETPINPFDFWQGANFKLKIVKKDGFWNYDKSEFDSLAPLLDDDDALEAIWKKEYSLAAVTATDQFKSYEDLERRLKYVLGKKPAQSRYIPDSELEDESEGKYAAAEKTVAEAVSTPTPSTTVDMDEDDALSYFQKLAES
tara:strand:+ start:367 stop:1278 length:912 start_codon:yes stop_codon:yes gene_type:complete